MSMDSTRHGPLAIRLEGSTAVLRSLDQQNILGAPTLLDCPSTLKDQRTCKMGSQYMLANCRFPMALPKDYLDAYFPVSF